jgi:predicted PurR-regulated permease PerM
MGNGSSKSGPKRTIVGLDMSMMPPSPDPTSTPPPLSTAETPTERRALAGFALAAVVAIAWIAQPVAIGILLGALTAFALQPLYDKLRLYTRRSSLAALGCVLVSALGFGATLTLLSYLFVARGVVMARSLIAWLSPGGAGLALVEHVAGSLGPLRFEPEQLTSKLGNAAAEVASRAATIAGAVASATASALLVLFFLMMTVHFTLENWHTLARQAESVLPLRPRYTRDLLDEFRLVGRTTLLGTVATGLAQGAFAGLGFLVTGVPEPAFFGAATALASLIPGVGTLLVWVPTGIFLIANGHVAKGVLMMVWGAVLVVGVSDYVIRPALVGRHSTMPALLTFTALFGGVEAFGLIGLILGPLVMALSFSLLRLFAREAAPAAHRI